MHYVALLIACLSIVLQFIAALWSARLIRLSGRGVAWAMISGALALMTMRRAVALWGMFKAPATVYLDLSEAIGFFISLLLCLGVFRIEAYFRHSRSIEGSREGWKQLFGRLFERADEGTLLIDRGRIVGCNDKAAHILGYAERSSLIGQSPEDLSPQRQPDGRLSHEKAEAMMAHALAKGNVRFEWVHKSVDGTPVPVEIVLTKIEVEGDTLLHTSWRDLSETKRAELALRESLQTSEELVRHVPSGVFLFQFDPVAGNFTLLGGNHEAERITGASITAWRGNDITAVFPDIVQRGLDAGYRDVMLTGREHTREDLVYKDRHLQSACRVHAFRLPGGRLAVIYEDIAEQKRAEEALHALETQHRLLRDSLPQGILIEDDGGRVVSVNPAAEHILGLGTARVEGTPAADSRWRPLRPDGSPLPRSELPTDVALRTGAPVREVVMSILNPLLGARRVLKVSAAPLFRQGEEQPYQVYTTIADITDVTLAQEEIRRLHAQVQSQSSSSDLGALLTGLKEISLSIPAGLQSIRAVVDGLLLFTSVNSEEVHVQPVDPGTLVRQIIDGLSLPDRVRPVEWAVEPMASVETDPIMFKRVLRILLENAVEFSRPPHHAEVRVGCAGEGAARVFFVKDNGVGFDASDAEPLFGAFQRLHKTRGLGRTGINLAIARRTMCRLGGWLWAESAPEHGATFYFYLPGA